MKRYLAALHEKPEHHKKRFAFLASGTITLLIFGVWLLTTFGIHTGAIAESGSVAPAVSSKTSAEVSPFQSLYMNFASTLQAIQKNFGALKSAAKSVDLEVKYKEMKTGALNTYGQ